MNKRGKAEKKIRMFKIKPYTVTLDTGKKIFVDNEIVVGNMYEDGDFRGACFDDGSYECDVHYTKKEVKEKFGDEIFFCYRPLQRV